MSQFNIDEIEKRTLSGLKDFQRATVERVDICSGIIRIGCL